MNKAAITCLCALLLTIPICHSISKNNYKLKLNCSSEIVSHWENNRNEMQSILKLDFYGDDDITMIIDGKITLDGHFFILKRRLSGKYQHINKNTYLLSQYSFSLAGSDNTPPDVINHHVFNFTKEKNIYFTINKIENNWLVGTPYSPGYICENDD